MLRKSEKPVILAVNKVDNEKQKSEAAEFYKLGFEEPLSSAAIMAGAWLNSWIRW